MSSATPPTPSSTSGSSGSRSGSSGTTSASSGSPPTPSSISHIVGAQDVRWSLARAVDALGDAARQAGRPGWIWVAGFFYPTLSLGFANLGEQISVKLSPGHEGGLQIENLEAAIPKFVAAIVVTVLFSPIAMRLIAGLARIATPSTWTELSAWRRAPRLADAWIAGKGHALASLGLWLQLIVMVVTAGAVLIVPPFFFLRGTGLQVGSWAFLVLLGPFSAVWMIYGLLLSVLYQLSLHSLVQNRRGVASALIHAWRIARNDPWATTRAVLVDFVLYVVQAVLALALITTCVGVVLVPLLVGFLGCTRAAFWARAYRALGGLSPDDRVPGLATPAVGQL